MTEKVSKILKCQVLSSFCLSVLKAPINMVSSVSKSWFTPKRASKCKLPWAPFVEKNRNNYSQLPRLSTISGAINRSQICFQKKNPNKTEPSCSKKDDYTQLHVYCRPSSWYCEYFFCNWSHPFWTSCKIPMCFFWQVKSAWKKKAMMKSKCSHNTSWLKFLINAAFPG